MKRALFLSLFVAGLVSTSPAAAIDPATNAPRVTLDLPTGANPIPPGPFEPTWDSIREHYRTPTWAKQGKFGIFIHWGLYSVPARNSEWYERHMYATRGVIDWHRERFGPPDQFGYKDFIPLFKAERFDPVAWAELFKQAGASYVMPVAEHHDGFAMYDSALTRWDAKDMGPRRDLIGELATAVKDAGLVFALSNHRMEHWNFMVPAPGLKTDLFDPAYADFYGPPQGEPERPQGGDEVMLGLSAPQSAAFLEEWLRRNQELVDKYQPQMIFFDNGINARALDPIKLRFAAYYYNRGREWGKEVTLTTKKDAYLAGTVKDFERGRPPGILPYLWQNDTSIAHNSWGYIEGMVYRNAGEMIRELIDGVSKNGNYLLNIAPRSDGTIPDEQQLRLLQIGEWLRMNGEAINGSEPWHRFGEGPTVEAVNERDPARGITNGMLRVYQAGDMRFTTRDGNLYAILFAWPPDDDIVITSLAPGAPGSGSVTRVSLLGSPARIAFTQEAGGLKVRLPPIKPCDGAWVLKIEGLGAGSGTL